MQVRCDVCGAEPAAVLCCADEAALCSACDRRVHRANKLAHKHRRLPLVQPSGGDSDSDTAAPLCDVCKVRACVPSLPRPWELLLLLLAHMVVD